MHDYGGKEIGIVAQLTRRLAEGVAQLPAQASR
jgi:hypothetical protein